MKVDTWFKIMIACAIAVGVMGFLKPILLG